MGEKGFQSILELELDILLQSPRAIKFVSFTWSRGQVTRSGYRYLTKENP